MSASDSLLSTWTILSSYLLNEGMNRPGIEVCGQQWKVISPWLLNSFRLGNRG